MSRKRMPRPRARKSTWGGPVYRYTPGEVALYYPTALAWTCGHELEPLPSGGGRLVQRSVRHDPALTRAEYLAGSSDGGRPWRRLLDRGLGHYEWEIAAGREPAPPWRGAPPAARMWMPSTKPAGVCSYCSCIGTRIVDPGNMRGAPVRWACASCYACYVPATQLGGQVAFAHVLRSALPMCDEFLNEDGLRNKDKARRRIKHKLPLWTIHNPDGSIKVKGMVALWLEAPSTTRDAKLRELLGYDPKNALKSDARYDHDLATELFEARADLVVAGKPVTEDTLKTRLTTRSRDLRRDEKGTSARRRPGVVDEEQAVLGTVGESSLAGLLGVEQRALFNELDTASVEAALVDLIDARREVAAQPGGAELIERDLRTLDAAVEAYEELHAFDVPDVPRSSGAIDALDDIGEPVSAYVSDTWHLRERILRERLARGYVTTSGELDTELDAMLLLWARNDPTAARMLAGAYASHRHPPDFWRLLAVARFRHGSKTLAAARTAARARLSEPARKPRSIDPRASGGELAAAATAAALEVDRMLAVCGLPSLTALNDRLYKARHKAWLRTVANDEVLTALSRGDEQPEALAGAGGLR